MNKSLSKFLQIAIPLALGIFLIWYIYGKFTPEQKEQVLFHFKNANYAIVALAVLLSIFSHVIRAYRWNFMLEPLGYRPKLLNNFMAVSIAYVMNIFIPKSGEVSRALVLSKYEKVPFDKGFGTIISERIVDLILLFLFTMIALLLEFDTLYTYLKEIVPVKKIGIAIAGLALLGILFLLFMKYSKNALSLKIKKLISGLKDGVLSIATMRKKVPFIIHSLLIWVLYILSFYTATQALPDTSTISVGTVIITFVVGSFAFAFTNSGFGTYPAAIMGILLVFGIPETLGTAFGWIVWTSNIAAILLFGALSFIFLPIYNRNRL
ncbi:lysylphosphatidylglycerol synthase transmembrane domain-containing protein [Aureisphaera galaxeae]|uniref:lysylphosphatidylglycerol synthase transmembrane domain-containing protein n=1 Tax=Aureisphaera galaxeae TaxID=1538023 RepID=UPI00234FDA92|nr:lysylphosphatidylglycerol synthase transmembrane domain-containing protein [Aureisphaera galaxeae]MDC8002669.1 lysylphosphatidylglycerol synthase transmembrane domain-containing protein [Aureisphaera galaxeae]